jgi:hypothetical protein
VCSWIYGFGVQGQDWVRGIAMGVISGLEVMGLNEITWKVTIKEWWLTPV